MKGKKNSWVSTFSFFPYLGGACKQLFHTSNMFSFDRFSYEINSEGIPYDYDSIMHYGKNAFSKDRDNLVTIRTKDRSMQDRIGQRKGVLSNLF